MGQRLWILYFGRGGSVWGVWTDIGDVNMGGLGTDMGDYHIMGVGEFWDRHC